MAAHAGQQCVLIEAEFERMDKEKKGVEAVTKLAIAAAIFVGR
jgi:hypothetical protein